MHAESSPHRKRIYLARHGQSIANLEKKISGQLNTPLSPKGKDQAKWLQDVMMPVQLSAIYSSSLQRSIETAFPTAKNQRLTIHALDGLKEIHFGELQGQAVNSSEPLLARQWHFDQQKRKILQDAGCETYEDFEHRVKTTLCKIISSFSGSALIVGHRNTNEVILKHLLSEEISDTALLNIKNKYLYEIELEPFCKVNTIRLGGERHGQKFQGLKCD